MTFETEVAAVGNETAELEMRDEVLEEEATASEVWDVAFVAKPGEIDAVLVELATSDAYGGTFEE